MHKITANKAGTACYENCHFKILRQSLSPQPYELGKHQQFDCRSQTLSLRFKHSRLSFHGNNLNLSGLICTDVFDRKIHDPLKAFFLDDCV